MNDLNTVLYTALHCTTLQIPHNGKRRSRPGGSGSDSDSSNGSGNGGIIKSIQFIISLYEARPTKVKLKKRMKD